MLLFVLLLGKNSHINIDSVHFLFVFQIHKLSWLHPSHLVFCPEACLLLTIIFVPRLWIKCNRTPLALVMSITVPVYNVCMLPSFVVWVALIKRNCFTAGGNFSVYRVFHDFRA